MASSSATSTRTPRSRLLTILLIVGSILLVLVGAFMIYAILVGPSKQPYRDALTQYKNVYNANIAVINSGAGLQSSSASDEQFQKNIQTVQATLTSLEKENEALGQKAVLKTGEGQQRYTVFNDKLVAYLAYNTDIIASIQKVRPVVYSCTSKMGAIVEDTASIEAMRTCAANLTAIQDVPDADYRQLVTSFKDQYAELANVLSAMAALQDPKGADAAQYQAYTTQRDDSIQTLTTASGTLAKNLQAHRQAVDITNAAQALDNYLSRASSII